MAKRIKIDSQKMKEFISDKHLTLAEASAKIGRGHDTLGGWIREGSIPERDLIVFGKVFGVPIEKFQFTQITSDDVVKEDPAPNPQRVKETLTRVAEIMKKEEQPKKDESWKDEPVFTWWELLEQYRRGYADGFKTGRKEAHDEN